MLKKVRDDRRLKTMKINRKPTDNTFCGEFWERVTAIGAEHKNPIEWKSVENVFKEKKPITEH